MKNPMKKSTSFPIPVMPLFSVLCFFLLLTFPKLSIEGARNGLLLWFQTIVPTLFPFLICSGLVTSMGGISYLVKPIYPVFHTFFGMSESGIYTFLLGIFCGFPMGAKTCRDLLEGGALSPKEAKCLMAVCNQPSSMFLLGYTASALHNGISIKLILFCLYLPLIPLWFLARKFYHLYANKAVTASAHITAPHISPNTPTNTPKPPLSLDHMILSSMELLIRIGGYLMIFSVISLFIRHFSQSHSHDPDHAFNLYRDHLRHPDHLYRHRSAPSGTPGHRFSGFWRSVLSLSGKKRPVHSSSSHWSCRSRQLKKGLCNAESLFLIHSSLSLLEADPHRSRHRPLSRSPRMAEAIRSIDLTSCENPAITAGSAAPALRLLPHHFSGCCDPVLRG